MFKKEKKCRNNSLYTMDHRLALEDTTENDAVKETEKRIQLT